MSPPLVTKVSQLRYFKSKLKDYTENSFSVLNLNIVKRNGNIVWQVVWKEQYSAELEFPKILVLRLPQNTLYVNTEYAEKSKQLYVTSLF